MKTLILALAIMLAGCSTLRGITKDEYTSEAEMLDAFDVEMAYWNIADPVRVAALRLEITELYRKLAEARITFDEDTLRLWVIERIGA